VRALRKFLLLPVNFTARDERCNGQLTDSGYDQRSKCAAVERLVTVCWDERHPPGVKHNPPSDGTESRIVVLADNGDCSLSSPFIGTGESS